MALIIKEYTNYEERVLDELKTESATTLVSLYPELKASELIVEQINIYNSNANQIKYLKSQIIEYTVSKWWLYFGY